MISDGAKKWIAAATLEQLEAKAEEYAQRDTDKPRDVELRAELRLAIHEELAKRGFPKPR